MSGETEANISGWTTDTLHTHVMRQLELLRGQIDAHHNAEMRATDLAFQAQQTAMQTALSSAERAVAAALAAQKEAVTVATVAAEKRADIQNEWRASLNDVLLRAMPRTEAEQLVQRLTERISEVASISQRHPTREESNAQFNRLGEQIAELVQWRNRVEGQSIGRADNRAGIYAAIAAVGVLITIVVVVANLLSGGG